MKCFPYAFALTARFAASQPLVKRVVQSSVYRGLKQLPRRNDPRGLTLLVRACQAVLVCLILTDSLAERRRGPPNTRMRRCGETSCALDRCCADNVACRVHWRALPRLL